MKEHYVSYEQSVKLKELGFDWKCDHYYTYGYENLDSENTNKIVRFHTDIFPNIPRTISVYGLCYSAPRLDQAGAWLRERYGIHVSANPYYICHRDEYGNIYEERDLWSFELMRVPSVDYRTIGDGGDYESYEQALSAGISKSLELLGKEVKE